MGEQRRRLSRLQALQGPNCVYCGGVELGTTIDHMPPIAIFTKRQRPQGLEFVCCLECNSGARPDEQVVAMLSRVLPDALDRGTKAEAEAAISAVANNNRDLLLEMMPNQNTQRRFFREREKLGKLGADIGGALVASGPLLTDTMQRFGAKLALALHHHEIGRPVPISGGVLVRWFSNYDLASGTFPAEVFSFLGPSRTLRQGKFYVANQFEYARANDEDGEACVSVHLATFGRSFATLAFVAERLERLGVPPGGNVFQPGFLKRPRVKFPTLRTRARWTQD